MIFLFTDYGSGPYQGQLESAVRRHRPDARIIHLCTNAPRCNPRAAAYLLSACCAYRLPAEALLIGIVDPGVGTWEDPPLVLRLEQRWYVGPDNGLFDILRRRDRQQAWHPAWRPDNISPSFHGRDLYAPLAARILDGWRPPETERAPARHEQRRWPDELPEIIYLDHFGNALSGLQARHYSKVQRFLAGNRILRYADTFGGAQPGAAFWHTNSAGLVEFSVNQGSAAATLALEIGAPVTPLPA